MPQYAVWKRDDSCISSVLFNAHVDIALPQTIATNADDPLRRPCDRERLGLFVEPAGEPRVDIAGLVGRAAMTGGRWENGRRDHRATQHQGARLAACRLDDRHRTDRPVRRADDPVRDGSRLALLGTTRRNKTGFTETGYIDDAARVTERLRE